MSKERATRALFGVLLPGDVLVHCSNENDIFMVVRVGTRLDFLHLIDGRYREAWVFAGASIPDPYDVVRGDAVIIGSVLSTTE